MMFGLWKTKRQRLEEQLELLRAEVKWHPKQIDQTVEELRNREFKSYISRLRYAGAVRLFNQHGLWVDALGYHWLKQADLDDVIDLPSELDVIWLVPTEAFPDTISIKQTPGSAKLELCDGNWHKQIMSSKALSEFIHTGAFPSSRRFRVVYEEIDLIDVDKELG